MAELTNDFTWSKSRHEKFGECLRAYYYQYYGSWGGWEAAPGSRERELYVLKKLSSRWQWAGSVVHGAIRDMLRRERGVEAHLGPHDRGVAARLLRQRHLRGDPGDAAREVAHGGRARLVDVR